MCKMTHHNQRLVTLLNGYMKNFNTAMSVSSADLNVVYIKKKYQPKRIRLFRFRLSGLEIGVNSSCWFPSYENKRNTTMATANALGIKVSLLISGQFLPTRLKWMRHGLCFGASEGVGRTERRYQLRQPNVEAFDIALGCLRRWFFNIDVFD